ncbi:hypothetical protein Salmuc_02715 [Salipiger mucosus DSM 16094]|uniref:Uncharacterized protein n=1 Tax=Salipiger mucosus DSM 16094 TaxID=1123237 RepID=S9QVA2_9RHOB|nr:hypothetical protein Salmuc_02715 [Salipiger mucosus DSM 16094]
MARFLLAEQSVSPPGAMKKPPGHARTLRERSHYVVSLIRLDLLKMSSGEAAIWPPQNERS